MCLAPFQLLYPFNSNCRYYLVREKVCTAKLRNLGPSGSIISRKQSRNPWVEACDPLLCCPGIPGSYPLSYVEMDCLCSLGRDCIFFIFKNPVLSTIPGTQPPMNDDILKNCFQNVIVLHSLQTGCFCHCMWESVKV